MLSEAKCRSLLEDLAVIGTKHLLFLVENEQKQILRFLESDGLHRSPEIGPRSARDDIVGALFISLVGVLGSGAICGIANREQTNKAIAADLNAVRQLLARQYPCSKLDEDDVRGWFSLILLRIEEEASPEVITIRQFRQPRRFALDPMVQVQSHFGDVADNRGGQRLS